MIIIFLSKFCFLYTLILIIVVSISILFVWQRQKILSIVSFGGNWSEELLTGQHMQAALDTIHNRQGSPGLH